MSEDALIRKAQAGDHDAFCALLKTYDRQIMSVVYRFTANRYDREDLYQEVFLHCFRALPSFRFKAAFSTWLYRLALNRCIRYMHRHRQPSEPVAEQAVQPANWEQREKLRAVKRALRCLSKAQHIAFHLHYIEHWSEQEIAAVLNCRPGTVKSHLNRARQKVRQHTEVLKWQESMS